MTNRWLMLLVLFLARIAMGYQFQSLASVSLPLVRDLAIDLALFGVLVGAYMLPGVFAAIPGGLLGRRFGDKRVVLFGQALMATGGVVTAGSGGYPAALAGRIVSGTGAVLMNVLLSKMVADWFADRGLATAMGVLMVSWPVGIGLALVTLGPLAAVASWPIALQAVTWICAAAFLLVALIYRDPPAAGARPTEPQAGSHLTRQELIFASLSGVIWTCYNAAYVVAISFAPLLLATRGLPAADATLITSAATWPLVISIPLGGVLADRTGRGEAIMHGCFVATALGIPMMLVAPWPLVSLAVVGLAIGPAAGVVIALPARTLRPESLGLGMGIYYTCHYLGMAVLPGVAGWCWDRTGIAAAPLLFASLLLIAAILCALLFQRFAQRSAQALA